jgi:glycosyltransferase involved in cell wall biosynthesis
MTAEPRASLKSRSRFIRSARNGGSAMRLTVDDFKRPSGTTKLSILMPAFNEERTVRSAIEGVLAQEYPIEVELCVIDDGSTDSTPDIIREIRDPRLHVHRHPRNLGKGASILTGAALATGSHMVPFDADLEYSSVDLPRMLEPIIEGRCDVVFGTRIFGMNTSYQSLAQGLGNRALTLTANVLFNTYLSDLHTCLKMMPLSLFRALDLRETRFGLDAEVAARILQLGIRPFEVPVSYHSRSVADGKKITWFDGLQCLGVLVRVRRARSLARLTQIDAPELFDTASSASDDVLNIRDTDYDARSAVVRAP